MPTATIVIPTRRRAQYLEVALASLAPQGADAGAEVIVVSDGVDPATAAVAQRHGARLLTLGQPGGPNAARNAGIRAARSDLLLFVDDDVAAPPGWLKAMLAGVSEAPDRDVFGGPIRARLEGGGPRGCGREPAPITTLELGSGDRDVPLVWSANMGVRRRAFEQLGLFDESLVGRGEEEEWERRYTAAGGQVRYVADAWLEHRRMRSDATLRRLSRAAYVLGRSARRYDVRKRTAPAPASELRTLAGCAWHVLRRRCLIGLVMAAHAAGRIAEALSERRS